MSMKLSELKKEIKNNIYEILSEENIHEEDPQVKKINDKIQKDPKFLQQVKSAMASAEKGNTTDLAMLMGGFGKMAESEDEKEDNWNKEDKEDKRADDKEPSKAELAKEKTKGAPSKFKVPTDQFEDFKDKLKTLVKKIKDMEKGAERDKKMAALKQFIKKPELVKAFKERDVEINTGGLVG